MLVLVYEMGFNNLDYMCVAIFVCFIKLHRQRESMQLRSGETGAFSKEWTRKKKNDFVTFLTISIVPVFLHDIPLSIYAL